MDKTDPDLLAYLLVRTQICFRLFDDLCIEKRPVRQKDIGEGPSVFLLEEVSD